MEDAIGFRFARPELLRSALTHRSFSSEGRAERCNERLEFLGDSILSAVVAHRLYELYPDEDEGGLSKRRSLLVSRPALARWAEEIGLGSHLYLGTGEANSGGRRRPSILADALEALLGAVYLDGGYAAAGAFIRRWLLSREALYEETDYKSRLQEVLQKHHGAPPVYGVVQTTGPEHEKTFLVKVGMGRRTLGRGAGKSKKLAEQAAARNALERLGGGTWTMS